MYDFLEGRVEELSPTRLSLLVAGVGYELACSLQTSRRMQRGAQHRLWTHLVVREDLLALYGFHSQSERALFRELVAISGVGPKVALAVLSSLSEEQLIEAVRLEQPDRLQQVPGIGRKTADRLLLELKSRVEKLGLAAGGVRITGSAAVGGGSQGGEGSGSQLGEAVEALVALGYKAQQAEQELARALKQWQKDHKDEAPSLEEWIRLVLMGKKG
jgi:Holliday junction DNA helicase RuvA